MAYLYTKIPILVYFGKSGMENFVIRILRPFGTFCSYLVFGPFGIFCRLVQFSPILVYCSKENLATLDELCPITEMSMRPLK
jgi:hypothetical protein